MRTRRVRLLACLALSPCLIACPGGRAEVALPTDAPGLLVLPAGLVTAARTTLARIETRSLMEALATYERDRGKLPGSLSTLVSRKGLAAHQSPFYERSKLGRAHAASASELDDPWGRPYRYVAPDLDSPQRTDWTLTLSTLGADGVEGGEGANADIVITEARQR